jgi:phage recombination protein Bet
MTDRALTTAQVLQGLGTVRGVLAPDLNDEELRLFAMVANRSGLDPFAKQIYALKRKGRVTFQTGIDGYRSIAARTGMYDGQDEPEYGPVCECGDDRPAGHPEFATVRVYRKGVTRAIAATAYWHEYKPDKGENGRGDAMWTKMPRVMIAKVAEALALRKAFPYDPENRQGIGADIYTADEMSQAGTPEPRAPQPTLAEKAAMQRAAIDDPKRFVDAAIADVPQEAEYVEVDADATPEPVAAPEQPTDSTVCGAVAAAGLMAGEACTLAPHDKGAHKNANGSWPLS